MGFDDDTQEDAEEDDAEEGPSNQSIHLRDLLKDFRREMMAAVSAVGLAHVLYVQPLELVKVRMQINRSVAKRPNTLAVAYSIYYNEGFVGFYRGVSAVLAKQVLYTGTRFALYDFLLDFLRGDDSLKPPLRQRMLVGLIAGGTAAFLATPSDLAFVRMVSDKALPHFQQKQFNHVGEAITQIARQEGFKSLWRGAAPTILKAMLINSIQLSVYSEIKSSLRRNYAGLKKKKNYLYSHVPAALGSTFVTAVIVSPVDMIKTRMQLPSPSIISPKPFSGNFNCFIKIVHTESVGALWKGFTPHFIRLMPATMIATYLMSLYSTQI